MRTGGATLCAVARRPLHNAGMKKGRERGLWIQLFGAGNGTRTRDINLGKVALYQLSYSR